jgi:5-methylcytosine-specific restriction endonuclease McrA
MHGERRNGQTRRRVRQLFGQGLSNAEVARALGISTATVSYHARKLGIPPDVRFSNRIDWIGVQIAHDAGMSVRECARTFGFHKGSWTKAVNRGAIKPRDHRIPLEKLLVKGRKTARGQLKIRLLAAELLKNRCDNCGITSWRGKRLALELHHVNGDGLDNRLENLQLLCPNCHSQTDTWGGRNLLRKNGTKGSRLAAA